MNIFLRPLTGWISFVIQTRPNLAYSDERPAMTDDTQTISLSLDEISQLAHSALIRNGCDEPNAAAIADIVMRAERDGSASHGLFRIPGYIGSLRSGKVRGDAAPVIENHMASIVRIDGAMGYAPYSLECGLPVLAAAARRTGVAVMSLVNSFHFAALWPETEYLAEQGLVGLACTAYKPTMAPAGSTEAFFGTNPLSFAFPRPGALPYVFDMATSRLAKGDVQIAARDGHTLPPDAGLDAEGRPSTDPAEVLSGVLLPFGGYKGSAIAMMVELLCAGVTGDQFSYEAGQTDIEDGGPAKGGELILALNPELIAGAGWKTHTESFFDKIGQLDGVRLAGQRRHQNRLDMGPRQINAELVSTIRTL